MSYFIKQTPTLRVSRFRQLFSVLVAFWCLTTIAESTAWAKVTLTGTWVRNELQVGADKVIEKAELTEDAKGNVKGRIWFSSRYKKDTGESPVNVTGKKTSEHNYSTTLTGVEGGKVLFSNLGDTHVQGSLRIRVVGTRIKKNVKADFFLVREQTESERLPVIFIPGVGGTWLYSVVNGSKGQVWPFAPGKNRIHMEFNTDGKHAGVDGATIEVGEVMKSGGPLNFYGDMLDRLKAEGWQPGKTLFEFPYDWRKANDSHEEIRKLHELVLNAKRLSGAKKVALVAHSMGGIRARVYALHPDFNASAHVDRIVTMGTPYGGATKVYYGLIHGYTFENHSVNSRMMKVLSQNFPALYQLLPHKPFIHDPKAGRDLSLAETYQIRYRNQVYDERFRGGILEYVGDNGWLQFLDKPERAANPKLVNAALRDFLPKYGQSAGDGGIDTYVIAGCWKATLAGYHIQEWEDVVKDDWFFPDKRHLLMPGGRKVVLAPDVSDGDGTVPRASSMLPSATRTYAVPDGDDISAAHGDLPSNPYVQNILLDILRRHPPDESRWQFPMDKMPGGLFGGLFGSVGVFRQRFNDGTDEIATSFILRSHSFLRIKDEKGRMLGFDEEGHIREDIPGSLFYVAGDAQYAVVFDPAKTYNVEVHGTDNGRFSLEVQSIQNSEVCANFEYQDVPVNKETLAAVSIRPGSLKGTPPSLNVQSGGAIQQITPKVLREGSCVDVGLDESGSETTLQANKVRVRSGETVRVRIDLSNAKEISNMNFNVLFDGSIAEPVGNAVRGSLLSNIRFENNTSQRGKVRIGFASESGKSGTGSVAYVEFRALGNPGDRTPVNLQVTTANHPDGRTPEVREISGEILIVGDNGFLPGDTDGNGVINELDAGDALKMSVDLIPVDLRADFDGDGKVTSRDATLIMQAARN